MSATREGWLQAAIVALQGTFFEPQGYALPERLGCSCGFPKGSSKAIGQCWDPEVATDGTTHLFISPTIDDPVSVLATLLHEMIHACVGLKEGHKGLFRKLAKEFGLAGKMTATYAAEDSDLYQKLDSIALSLGEYPHRAMRPKRKLAKPTNTWVRLQSVSTPEFKVMVSPRMMEAHGAPLDPWGDPMVEV